MSGNGERLVVAWIAITGALGFGQPALGDSTSAVNSPTQFVEFGDRRIAYRVVGSGAPLVLANRFRGNLDDWDPAFLDALAKNYRVYSFDYAGFGRSEGAPPETIMQFAVDVKDFAAALGINRFALLGWSFGGAVVQIVTTEFPELVSHTVLIGTRPPGENAHPISEQFYERALKPVNDLNERSCCSSGPSQSSVALPQRQATTGWLPERTIGILRFPSPFGSTIRKALPISRRTLTVHGRN